MPLNNGHFLFDKSAASNVHQNVRLPPELVRQMKPQQHYRLRQQNPQQHPNIGLRPNKQVELDEFCLQKWTLDFLKKMQGKWIPSKSLYRTLLFFTAFLLLSGCTTNQGSLQLKKLAKSNVNLVADIHRASADNLLKELHFKLYRRNPSQLHKVSGQTAESRWAQLSKTPSKPLVLPELGGPRGVGAMQLAFDNAYRGDRVFALMAGLTEMLRESYSYKQQFYLLDSMNEQKLYNSARNIEIMVWLLRNRTNAAGKPLILTDSITTKVINLSFERLFGKLIAQQDLLSLVIADKQQRMVNTVTHSIASMVFIPL